MAEVLRVADFINIEEKLQDENLVAIILIN
jgi:hypothetical protein